MTLTETTALMPPEVEVLVPIAPPPAEMNPVIVYLAGPRGPIHRRPNR
jgi:hypothetical protein